MQPFILLSLQLCIRAEARLGQSTYPGQICHFSLGHVDHWIKQTKLSQSRFYFEMVSACTHYTDCLLTLEMFQNTSYLGILC